MIANLDEKIGQVDAKINEKIDRVDAKINEKVEELEVGFRYLSSNLEKSYNSKRRIQVCYI